jgi:2-polyprenyl-3-methyl-5-hydroxy-6-metoxy-1,4-benzoquinol methylase
MTQHCESNLNCTENKAFLFEKNGIPIMECKSCHHRFADMHNFDNHIDEVYSDEYFFEGKAGYPNYLEEKDLLIKAGERYAKIVKRFLPTGELLDVGSAAGFIMKGFENFGWKCEGVEPNNTMAKYGRDNFNFIVSTSSLEDYLTIKKYDLITMIQVIGHFYDLHKAINNVEALLKPNGFLLIESWNVKSLIARFLGKKWHEYSPPSVLHWFSDDSLMYILENHGFELVAKGHPIKKINVKHAFSLLDEKLPKFVFKKQIFSWSAAVAGRLSVIYPLHDLKWYLFKKI